MKILLLSLMFFLFACTYNIKTEMSSSPVGKNEIPVATVSGSSSAIYFLGFRLAGDDSIAMAIQEAIQRAGADTLINVFSDKKIKQFPPLIPLMTEVETSVYGTAVKYNDPSFKGEIPSSVTRSGDIGDELNLIQLIEEYKTDLGILDFTSRKDFLALYVNKKWSESDDTKKNAFLNYLYLHWKKMNNGLGIIEVKEESSNHTIYRIDPNSKIQQ